MVGSLMLAETLAHVTPCRRDRAARPPTTIRIDIHLVRGCQPRCVALVTFRADNARRSHSVGACEGVHKSRS
jgi:hypothetical protein